MIFDLIDRLLDRRSEHERWAAFRDEHRWDELADYNARVSKGIVHTPEYAARMAEEQAAFDDDPRRWDPRKAGYG